MFGHSFNSSSKELNSTGDDFTRSETNTYLYIHTYVHTRSYLHTKSYKRLIRHDNPTGRNNSNLNFKKTLNPSSLFLLKINLLLQYILYFWIKRKVFLLFPKFICGLPWLFLFCFPLPHLYLDSRFKVKTMVDVGFFAMEG